MGFNSYTCCYFSNSTNSNTPQPTTTSPPLPAQPVYTQPAAAIPVPAGQATVDLGTLATVITPLVAAIAGIFVKNRRDMEKKDDETKQDTIKAIQEVMAPKLKQITPVAEQTAKQSVQLNQLAAELYKVMAEKANDIRQTRNSTTKIN